MQNQPFQNDIIRSAQDNNWLILSLIILALAFIIVRIVYHRYWRRYRQALLYNQESQKLIQEKNALLMQAAITMNVVAMFSLGMFVFLFSNRFKIFELLPYSFYGWMISTLAIAPRYVVVNPLSGPARRRAASVSCRP